MLLASLFLLAASAQAPETGAGPYVDSKGQVWPQLPRLEDYASAAEFDALFGREVFTDPHGRMIQIDRAATPEEIAANAQARLGRGFERRRGPAGGVRTTLFTHHPVDEEYRALFATTAALEQNIVGIIEDADNTYEQNFGINMVPRSGFAWDSADGAGIDSLLNEAINEGGGLGGQCHMIAFSADPTGGGAIGIAHIGQPECLVKRYIDDHHTAAIVQHEVGHTYTLFHCCNFNCIMQAFIDIGAFGNFHSGFDFCSFQNHAQRLSGQQDRYCP